MEFGTHDFLMATNGLYSNLVNAQMKQENSKYDDDSIESDEEMEMYKLITNTPLTSRFTRQTSIKVKYNVHYYSFNYFY